MLWRRSGGAPRLNPAKGVATRIRRPTLLIEGSVPGTGVAELRCVFFEESLFTFGRRREASAPMLRWRRDCGGIGISFDIRAALRACGRV